MTDIDFDELDREVNKLVNADTNTPQNDDTTNPPLSIQDDTQDSQDNTSDIQQSEDQQSSDSSDVAPSPVTRPRGRFMDVMHPSSDMTTETDSSQSDQLASTPDRKTLEPLDSSDTKEAAQEDTTDEKEDSDHSPSSHTDMPDPIDFHEERTAEGGDVQKEVEPSEEKEVESSPEPPILPLNNELNSLFNEAEVEKRPLGQFSKVEEPTVTINTVDGEKVSGETVKEDDKAEDTSLEGDISENEPVDLPPELEKDLVAIEAGESPDAIPSPVEEKNHTKDEQEEEKPADTKEDKELSTSAALLASGSIPQQYKIALKEKVSREGDHALFDSSHYEKAPTKAAKNKKSGHKALLQWIFIVIGLLLLGSTIGAGLFVFVSNQ